MISLRKLSTLSDGTRRRKSAVLIRDFEKTLSSGDGIDNSYLKGLLKQILSDGFWSEAVRSRAVRFSVDSDSLLRDLNSLRHTMLEELGRDWADWDIETAGDDWGTGSGLFPIRVYVDGLRSPFNIGSVMRTSVAFGMERLWFSPDGASPDHPRARRSSMGAHERIRWDVRALEELPEKLTGPVFSLELGGRDIADFEFPSSGTVIIGSEELGVSPSAMKRAEKDGGVVSIPLPGPKTSLNAGVAFGILIRRWIETLNTEN
jgi:TrmH family RNA methyltransferase